MASDGVNVIAEFSPCGDYLACSDSSGALQIWETSTGIKRQQYIPSSHLSATCSCISWSPKRTPAVSSGSASKRRRRSDTDRVVESLELIAIGTATGAILLYSHTNNALHTELVGGHTDRVTDACWSEEESLLYSCSVDGHIAEWTVSKSRCRHKWKSEETAVYSICLCHTQRHLLSAGRSIRLWDLETHEVLRVITGHQWPVFRVLQVASQSRRRHSDISDDVDSTIDGSYVISADTTDRHISVWQLKSSVGKKSVIRKTIASLTLPDDPPRQVKISCARLSKLQVAALTARGRLVVFQHVLNGPAGPLDPEHVIEIETESQGGTQLPVRAISFTPDDNVLVAYSGDAFLQPAFEKLQTEKLKKRTKLIREAPMPAAVSVEASVSKLRTPMVSDDVTVLTPHSMAPSEPAAGARPRKRRRRLSVDLTVEEKLSAMGTAETSMSSDVAAARNLTAPATDSLATLLSQGLISGDKKMLNNVLQHRDVKTIEQTVSRLPLPSIVPLVKELSHRMGGHAQSALVTRLWLKHLMAAHASYLMTLPDRESILGPLHQVMETRLDVLKKVSQLQGRLNLIFDQLKSKKPTSESWRTEKPQLVYEDDSSDEDVIAAAEVSQRDADVLSEDEWMPQAVVADEEMESVESSSSSDGEPETNVADIVDSKSPLVATRRSSARLGRRKSAETPMDRDSESNSDGDD